MSPVMGSHTHFPLDGGAVEHSGPVGACNDLGPDPDPIICCNPLVQRVLEEALDVLENTDVRSPLMAAKRDHAAHHLRALLESGEVDWSEFDSEAFVRNMGAGR